MKALWRGAFLLAVLAGGASGGDSPFSAQLQVGSSFIGAGSPPIFDLGGYCVDGSDQGLALIDYRYSTEVSRASFARIGAAYRLSRRAAGVVTMELGLPHAHMRKERTDLRWGSDEHSLHTVHHEMVTPDRAVATTGYLFAPALGLRATLAGWRAQPYVELMQGYLWREVDLWWDPSGLPRFPQNYRLHRRDRVSRAFLRAALGLSFPVAESLRLLAAAEWTSARNEPTAWYFLDWQGSHQRFDLSLGVSYTF